MKLTILSDNNTLIDQYLLGEPGFSCLIEAEGKRFLLDTGYFGVFAKNAETLGISWRDVDGVILSHCHDDHTKGLDAFFTEGRLIRNHFTARPTCQEQQFLIFYCGFKRQIDGLQIFVSQEEKHQVVLWNQIIQILMDPYSFPCLTYRE